MQYMLFQRICTCRYDTIKPFVNLNFHNKLIYIFMCVCVCGTRISGIVVLHITHILPAGY